MKTASLFTGIGGLELGLARAGHGALLTCEVWEPARAVLRTRFADVPSHDDVTTLEHLPDDTELLTAGFPCQDLSQAGRTLGIGGSRSGLVGHVFRLLDRRPVPVVVLENVSFMLSLDQGAAMNHLARAFEERGYRWAYRTLNSQAFLHQRRERVFFVATRNDLDPADVLFDGDTPMPELKTNLRSHAHGFYWTEGTRGLGWAPDAVPTLKNGSTVGIPSPPAILKTDGTIVKPDLRDAERLQGFPADWTKPAEEVGRSSLRWSLVGNAVSVPVAGWLGERLATPHPHDPARDLAWPSGRKSWPRAARFDGTERYAVDIGALPVFLEREPLEQFLRYPGTPLSVRGTAGFLSRAEASSLRFAPGFLDAVRRHLSLQRGDAGPALAA
ncbi:DNA cytosine methyltransferase [Salinarimonas ramus]|uniref:Cytosine-specific methyltransferase n=1 Tax=Salinarimonas ramus TaxID=690164 RepID=A0A917QDK5_9HYPH|nr:DNA (cytosine-5-)-methyltransferase [Salinarimonas ramus]GGK44770.1 putative BsuMI modification methylase subunit YdiP [Salinarimonas ramus]